MIDVTEIGGDVVTGASAFTGLVLVYLGAVVSSYQSYDPVQADTVRAAYQRRAWFATIGILVSALAVLSATFAKWFKLEWLGDVSVALFVIATFWVVLIAILTVREIR